MKKLDIVIFGLSITSAWGNGHATTYRSLVKALALRGHRITFFEKNVPWYEKNRDLAEPPFCRTVLYTSVKELGAWGDILEQADLVILGSYVPDSQKCAAIIKRLTPACFAFYDIDTPVTLAKLERGDFEYLHPEMIPEFDMYWSFSGGPILQKLEKDFGARRAMPLYCSVDTDLYYPDREGSFSRNSDRKKILLGYLGTYSEDRQPAVDELLVEPARILDGSRFCVAGAQYPEAIPWPENIELISHIPPSGHRSFYNAQRFTLNVTRSAMISAGFSPSVRLFEAGACATPVISDFWPGLDSFFRIGEEILVAGTSREVLEYLDIDDEQRLKIAEGFRNRIMKSHTSRHRALEVESYWQEVSAQVQAAQRSGETI